MTGTNHGLNIIVCSRKKTKSMLAGGTNPQVLPAFWPSDFPTVAVYQCYITCWGYKRCCYVSTLWWLTSWMNWLCRQTFLVLPPHAIQLPLYYPGFTLHASPLCCALRRLRQAVSDRSDLEHIRTPSFCEFVEKQLNITGTIWFQTRSR